MGAEHGPLKFGQDQYPAPARSPSRFRSEDRLGSRRSASVILDGNGLSAMDCPRHVGFHPGSDRTIGIRGMSQPANRANSETRPPPGGCARFEDGFISEIPNFSLFIGPKSAIYPLMSRPHEGRFAIVTDVGAGCGGREQRFRRVRGSRTAKSCGPDAPTLASSLRRESQATVANKPGHRGEREGNR